MTSFQLDRSNRKLLGVCSGLGAHFAIDPLLLRLAFVGSVLIGFGFPILIYFAIALIAD